MGGGRGWVSTTTLPRTKSVETCQNTCYNTLAGTSPRESAINGRRSALGFQAEGSSHEENSFVAVRAASPPKGGMPMYMTLSDFCQVMLMLLSFAGFLWTLWTYWDKRK